jgi:hypothetical protein
LTASTTTPTAETAVDATAPVAATPTDTTAPAVATTVAQPVRLMRMAMEPRSFDIEAALSEGRWDQADIGRYVAD